MPELPEVETVVRGLRSKLIDQRLRDFSIRDDRLEDLDRRVLLGRRVYSVERLAKQILIELRRGVNVRPCWLSIHLRMTGRLLWQEELDQHRPHLRAWFRFEDGIMSFEDVRRFGEIRLTSERESLDPGGIEPLGDGLSPAALESLIGESQQAIKVWLLRQDRIVGLGNIYVCEILYRSRISPFREARTLAWDELEKLCHATGEVLCEAVDCGGTTFSDYRDSWGHRGHFQDRLSVYGREGKLCFQCGESILRKRLQGRSTFYCQKCQPDR